MGSRTRRGGWARVRAFFASRGEAIALGADILFLALWYLWILPRFPRPVDVLTIAAVVLGAATALATRRGWLRNTALVAVSLAASIFGLEMLEKKFDLVAWFDNRIAAVSASAAGSSTNDPYGWDGGNSETYLAALSRARADGLMPAEEKRPADDPFAGTAPGTLWTMRVMERGYLKIAQGLKPMHTDGPPFGYELTPDNLVRERTLTPDGTRALTDTRITVDRFGMRETRGGAEADDVYLFLGCSFTFGAFLNDDETLPHWFAEGEGFAVRALNLGVNGHGPHQALAELQDNVRLGRAGVKPERVKGVVFSLIDDHPRRAIGPVPPKSPRYVLRDGKAVRYALPDWTDLPGRLALALDRTRIAKEIDSRIGGKGWGGELSKAWRLTFAILAEMHALCRERYGVPLTVVYWDENPMVLAELGQLGVNVLPASEALGPDCRSAAIKYYIFDMHPSSLANRKVAERLRRMLTDR